MKRNMDDFEFFPKCGICLSAVAHGPVSICYDPHWEINIWGGDSHRYICAMCDACFQKMLATLEKKREDK